MSNIEYILPKAELKWKDVNFDLQRALKHLNEYLIEFYKYREEIYVKSFLTFRLKTGIAGIQIMSGGKRLIYLLFMYNSDNEKKNLSELIEILNNEWRRTRDIQKTDIIIKDSFFGKRWYGYLDLQSRKLKITSHFKEIDVTEKVKNYFEMINFKIVINEDD